MFCFSIDAFDTEQLLECVEKLKCGQSVHIPIYDFKNHRRCSESFRQVMFYATVRCLSFIVLCNNFLTMNLSSTNPLRCLSFIVVVFVMENHFYLWFFFQLVWVTVWHSLPGKCIWCNHLGGNSSFPWLACPQFDEHEDFCWHRFHSFSVAVAHVLFHESIHLRSNLLL